MTIAQREVISKYNLSFEAEINGITYYTSEKEDGYYFLDDTDQCGIFTAKEYFYDWANKRERLSVHAIPL